MDRLIFAIELGAPAPSTEVPSAPLTAAGWLELVGLAEQAGADFVTIADQPRPDRSRPAHGVSRGTVNGRLDAIMVACRVAPATRRIGIVPAASTTLTEPFLLSAQIATLDHVSHGRAGWQLDVSDAPGDALYVGPRPVPKATARYREAAEHAEVVRRLWDSWDDGAEIRDSINQRFIDRDRIHHIDFAGEHFEIRGPSITPRPPQGQPVIVAVVDRPEMAALAAAVADVAVLAPAQADDLHAGVRALRQAAADAPRRGAELRVLAHVDVALVDTPVPAAGPCRLTVTGRASDAALQLGAWAELGINGFRLRPIRPIEDLTAIAGPLRTELQALGLWCRADTPSTLRGVLGLPRPTSRVASS